VVDGGRIFLFIQFLAGVPKLGSKEDIYGKTYEEHFVSLLLVCNSSTLRKIGPAGLKRKLKK